MKQHIYQERPFSQIPYNQPPLLSAGLSALRREILEEIITKGGLYAVAAQLYMNDERKGSYFIAECFDQCHHLSTAENWGKELVLKIIYFRLELIRHPMRQIANRVGLFERATTFAIDSLGTKTDCKKKNQK